MGYRKRHGNNQIVEACINSISHWGRIATKVSAASICSIEGVEFGCNAVDHEKDGIVDP